jgi:hypothetical protein
MAKAAGYRSTCTIRELDDLQKRLPGLLAEEGPILVQLITGLAESTPMTAGPSTPFHQQVAELQAKLGGAR